jgi:hypothetical protein
MNKIDRYNEKRKPETVTKAAHATGGAVREDSPVTRNPNKRYEKVPLVHSGEIAPHDNEIPPIPEQGKNASNPWKWLEKSGPNGVEDFLSTTGINSYQCFFKFDEEKRLFTVSMVKPRDIVLASGNNYQTAKKNALDRLSELEASGEIG